MNFDSLKLAEPLLKVVAELGFKELTPIQAQSIPVLLEGRDLIGQSKTGSGKTAAFAFPILQKIDLSQNKIQALVVCPTRELCTQVAREIRRFGRHFPGLNVLILAGGQPVHPQIKSFKKGVHIAVGTPGRLLDLLGREALDFRRATTVVLDEADRMLDMGFRPDIEAILEKLPKHRQTIFFSATFPASIEAMSGSFQKNPFRVTIETQENIPTSIQQEFYGATFDQKPYALNYLLAQKNPESALIFCNLKATVMELEENFLEEGLSAGCLHGDMAQADRDRVMAKFRNLSIRFLVATDVAARGLDVAGLDMVINFDLPPQTDTYVHRIGRTGRAGHNGLACSLVSPREKLKLKMIGDLAGMTFELKALPEKLHAETKGYLEAAKMKTLYISGGRKEKMRPGDILGALTGESGGLSGDKVGKIEIHDHFSYVAVSKESVTLAQQRLRAGSIKGRKFKIELVR